MHNHQHLQRLVMPVYSSPEPETLDKRSSDQTSPTRNTTPPTSLRTSISPPPSRARRSKGRSDKDKNHLLQRSEDAVPNLAAIEAGEVRIRNHLEYFSHHLSHHARPNTPLSIPSFMDLYKRNQHPHGRHWVIHQHDHPVAGVHYDLRLQINETSSVSWAIMYGMPGNANSMRLNRNATETRIHNVWNHLLETASSSTGSLLIWDTGEYEMLPYREPTQRETDDELSPAVDEGMDPSPGLSDSQRLHQAFQDRKIRIRLRGTHLPKNYTLSIRLLTSENRHTQPPKPSRKRRRKASAPSISSVRGTPPTSDIDDDVVTDVHPASLDPSASALEREIAEQEDEQVRLTNAYPGATNSICSIHQRRWYLSMDRYASGFRPLPRNNENKGGRREWARRWEDGELLGFEPFFVMGRDVERSVVTGRRAEEVMADEGVDAGWVGRRGWRGVVE